MSNELDIFEKNQLTANEVRAQINLIQEVMQSVMKEGVHYGHIPGCGDKPSLLKPGAEKILATFRLSAEPIVDDLSSGDEVRYRIKSIIVSPSGRAAGFGIGECSSNEDKYKWKKAVNDAEWEETQVDRRREKWFKGKEGKPDYKVKQIRTNIADVANTVLKMAKKRSLVDGCLTTTACSDIFEQDIEELDGVIDLEKQERQKVKTPKSKSAPATSSAPTGSEIMIGIADVTVSSGEFKDDKTGKMKPWTKYHIKDTTGGTWTTFDKKIAEEAKKAKESGDGVTIKTETKGQYTNIVEIKPMPINSEPESDDPELSKLAEEAAKGLNL